MSRPSKYPNNIGRLPKELQDEILKQQQRIRENMGIKVSKTEILRMMFKRMKEIESKEGSSWGFRF